MGDDLRKKPKHKPSGSVLLLETYIFLLVQIELARTVLEYGHVVGTFAEGDLRSKVDSNKGKR